MVTAEITGELVGEEMDDFELELFKELLDDVLLLELEELLLLEELD
ncbi:hypothetical protein GCM10011613_21010 [Cellvibrio zantedeschiae]|uniref:Uncharacterized protein n=1 Tax=Cellvibrio zantedeschiae TaxID=1237077 RepID=A0ABQ3B1S6_9GAMM|nr:hypothetical protein [Cellvibrio zantedeschiae]GGY75300.1 hypothetical protein GCM10011613_21010 [Cellvibrio zantedeschiae]